MVFSLKGRKVAMECRFVLGPPAGNCACCEGKPDIGNTLVVEVDAVVVDEVPITPEASFWVEIRQHIADRVYHGRPVCRICYDILPDLLTAA